MANTVSVIQARMGSSRLPGKVMLPLNCDHALEHVVRRVASADEVDEVVVATSDKKQDDIIANYTEREGVCLYRGSEEDVLGRMYEAALEHDADVVVRITADNPLLSPEAVDSAVQKLRNQNVDYVSNKIERTFPSGLDVEAFTFDSFTDTEQKTDDPYHREHVTPYYRESSEFTTSNLDSKEVFDEEFMRDRTDLRLTLDNPDDYELFRRIYEEVEYDGVLELRDAIRYVDENGLQGINTD